MREPPPSCSSTTTRYSKKNTSISILRQTSQWCLTPIGELPYEPPWHIGLYCVIGHMPPPAPQKELLHAKDFRSCRILDCTACGTDRRHRNSSQGPEYFSLAQRKKDARESGQRSASPVAPASLL